MMIGIMFVGLFSVRMKLSTGCYECRRTGLRVECSGDVELEYHTCDWESVSFDLDQESLTPCGPLINIKVISGELKTVYLPHFLCLGTFLLNVGIDDILRKTKFECNTFQVEVTLRMQ